MMILVAKKREVINPKRLLDFRVSENDPVTTRHGRIFEHCEASFQTSHRQKHNAHSPKVL